MALCWCVGVLMCVLMCCLDMMCRCPCDVQQVQISSSGEFSNPSAAAYVGGEVGHNALNTISNMNIIWTRTQSWTQASTHEHMKTTSSTYQHTSTSTYVEREKMWICIFLTKEKKMWIFSNTGSPCSGMPRSSEFLVQKEKKMVICTKITEKKKMWICSQNTIKGFLGWKKGEKMWILGAKSTYFFFLSLKITANPHFFLLSTTNPHFFFCWRILLQQIRQVGWSPPPPPPAWTQISYYPMSSKP